MAGRRILYLAALEGCLIFYIAYGAWFSWLLLMLVAFLPWFSLLLSLPAMLLTRAQLQAPAQVTMETPLPAQLEFSCPLPLPPVKGQLLVSHSLTGEKDRYAPQEWLPTDHCGLLRLQPTRLWVYDYLGLLRLPRKRPEAQQVTVLPLPVKAALPASLERALSAAFVPKPGGGHAEHHELRLYRPGDDLRGIHRKLSAKTGKLIYREPMVHRQGQFTLTLSLSGDPDTLDRKLGRLLFLGSQLLEKGLTFRVSCQTGSGPIAARVTDLPCLEAVLRQLLAAKPGGQGLTQGLWQHRIGGEPDEA